MSRATGRIGFLNGRYDDESRLAVGVRDGGFLLGDGVFETLRSWNGRPFDAAGHFARLVAGLDALGIPRPFDREGFGAIVSEVLSRNGVVPGGTRDLAVRVMVTRGETGAGYILPDPPPAPTVCALVRDVPDVAAARRRGLSTCESPLPRPGPVATEPPFVVKTTSLAAVAAAHRFARARGMDEALFFDEAGRLLEGTASSVFVLVDGEVRTPPLARGILPGTTRAVLMERIGAREADVTRDDLARAEGLFLTSSLYGPVPVRSFEGRTFPVDLPGHRAAIRAFDEAVACTTSS